MCVCKAMLCQLILSKIGTTIPHIAVILFTYAVIRILIIFTEGNNKEETYLIERLFSSSLVAIVTQSQKRKLKLCHFKVCTYLHLVMILLKSHVIFVFRKQQKYVVIITLIVFWH